MNDRNNDNDVSSIRARLMAMVPADQATFADFELRMLLATIEAGHLRDIHANWRPIADERNKLLQQMATPVATAEPGESRRGARTKFELLQKQFDELKQKYDALQDGTPIKSGAEDDSPRFKALMTEFNTLKNNHAGLRERNQTLHEEHSELLADYDALQDKYKELQIACGEVEPS